VTKTQKNKPVVNDEELQFNKTVVNDEELQFISEIVAGMEETKNNPVEYDIGANNGKDALLFQLGLADELQLVANYGKHHLVFSVQLKMGDFGNFRVAIKSPKIYEAGDRMRSWRLTANDSMRLVDDKDEELKYKIKDLSASGISLLIDDDVNEEFPNELNNIYLQLPGRDKLLLSGSKIRRVDDKSVAYSLGNSTDDAVLSTLAEYLFECHSKQHPEVHVHNFK
jgi:hypothetical protein